MVANNFGYCGTGNIAIILNLEFPKPLYIFFAANGISKLNVI